MLIRAEAELLVLLLEEMLLGILLAFVEAGGDVAAWLAASAAA